MDFFCQFSSSTVDFFEANRHSQWTLAIIDYKLSDHCDAFEYIRDSEHRATVSKDLKMPTTFKVEGKSNATGLRSKQTDDVYTQEYLIAYQAKFHDKAQKWVMSHLKTYNPFECIRNCLPFTNVYTFNL